MQPLYELLGKKGDGFHKIKSTLTNLCHWNYVEN